MRVFLAVILKTNIKIMVNIEVKTNLLHHSSRNVFGSLQVLKQFLLLIHSTSNTMQYLYIYILAFFSNYRQFGNYNDLNDVFFFFFLATQTYIHLYMYICKVGKDKFWFIGSSCNVKKKVLLLIDSFRKLSNNQPIDISRIIIKRIQLLEDLHNSILCHI